MFSVIFLTKDTPKHLGLLLETPSLRAGSETDCIVIFVTYNIWKQSVETTRVSGFLCLLYNHNSALTQRRSPLFTHCPCNTLLRKLLPCASLDSGLSR